MSFFANEAIEKVWKDRYQKDGETPRENLHRVARYCAKDPKEEEDFYNVMEKRLFYPAGRTMSNSGIGKELTLNNCFLENSKVITKRGMLNIQDVKVGDYVVSDDGSWQYVNNVMSREYNGDIFKLKFSYAYDEISCTPNHKFLTDEGWLRADRLVPLFRECSKLKSSHYVKIPSLRYEVPEREVCLTDFIETDDKFSIEFMDNDMVRTNTKFIGGQGSRRISTGLPIKNHISLNKDIQYLIGRWIGDGSVTRVKNKTRYSIFQIVFNSQTEQSSFEKCKKIIEDNFKTTVECSSNEKQHTLLLRVSNPILGEFFSKYVGTKCTNKRIPKDLIGSFDVCLGILDADGCVNKNGSIVLAMKNMDLISDVRDSLCLNGINCAPSKICKNKLNDKIFFAHSIYIAPFFAYKRIIPFLSKIYPDDRMTKDISQFKPNYSHLINEDIYTQLLKVDILENQSCKVYNLSIENTHTYTVNGVVVHNCFVSPIIRDSLNDIFDKVKLGAKTHQKGGGIGYSFGGIRPRGTPTSNDAIASGPVSFMDVFNAQTATIEQGSRRK